MFAVQVEMMDDDETSSTSSSSSTGSGGGGVGGVGIGLNSNNSSDNEDDLVGKKAGSGDLFADKTDPLYAALLATDGDEDESDERRRFQIELEFVQSLANPNYLNFLAQRGYFRNQTFLNYLKYLMYWKEPQYVQYIIYPQCLSLLELLQHEQFLKEIVNAQCSKHIDEQLLLLWLHYKKARDWIRIDTTQIPDCIEKLLKKQQFDHDDHHHGDDDVANAANNKLHDLFSASTFLLHEKF